jgi:UDP-4-amino-4,6-dideoxy-N-acetyl-beta-L-altrosamine transaminase
MIPYGRQDITQSDIEAVEDVLRSDFLTQGPAVPEFERQIAERVGAKHAIAVNSATSALHIACMALDMGPGDLLWTVPNTFVASANCARYCGSEVDFVDIDPDTWNLSLLRLQEKLSLAKKTNRLPKLLVPVHFAGQPTDEEAIWELAQQYGIRVLEDASHAIGASRNGEPVGSCRWSDITVFSYHPVKIITAGEGGMALTNNGDFAERMALARSHGITRDAEKFVQNALEPWHYEQHTLGYNYRMTDIQAALGTSQLVRLDANIARRNILAARYDRALEDLPLQLPMVKTGNKSAFHLYVVRLKDAFTKKSHLQVFEALREHGIGVNLHYVPVHLQPYYQKLGFSPGMYPESERHGHSAITLPLYPAMTDGEQDQVVRALRDVLVDA